MISVHGVTSLFRKRARNKNCIIGNFSVSIVSPWLRDYPLLVFAGTVYLLRETFKEIPHPE